MLSDIQTMSSRKTSEMGILSPQRKSASLVRLFLQLDMLAATKSLVLVAFGGHV